MSALDGGSELHVSAALAPSLSPVTAPVPIDRKMGGSHCCYWSFGEGKIFLPCHTYNHSSQFSSTKCSNYNDYTILVLQKKKYLKHLIFTDTFQANIKNFKNLT